MAQVRDCLIAHRVLAFRMQSGAHVAQHNGKQRLIRYGTPGMADWLAFPLIKYWMESLGEEVEVPHPLWLEIKSQRGRQTPDQKAFQKIVEDNGHSYAVVRSIEDLEEALKKTGAIR